MIGWYLSCELFEKNDSVVLPSAAFPPPHAASGTSIAAAATAAIILMDFFSMMYSSLCSIIGTRFTYVSFVEPTPAAVDTRQYVFN